MVTSAKGAEQYYTIGMNESYPLDLLSTFAHTLYYLLLRQLNLERFLFDFRERFIFDFRERFIFDLNLEP